MDESLHVFSVRKHHISLVDVIYIYIYTVHIMRISYILRESIIHWIFFTYFVQKRY